MEFPVVILVCSRHNPKTGEVGFLSLPNRVNVALSRCQRQLLIIGSKTTILHEDRNKGSQSLKDFVSAAGNDLYSVKGDI
jgi:superfamily I DNA and/or RNA helicase